MLQFRKHTPPRGHLLLSLLIFFASVASVASVAPVALAVPLSSETALASFSSTTRVSGEFEGFFQSLDLQSLEKAKSFVASQIKELKQPDIPNKQGDQKKYFQLGNLVILQLFISIGLEDNVSIKQSMAFLKSLDFPETSGLETRIEEFRQLASSTPQLFLENIKTLAREISASGASPSGINEGASPLHLACYAGDVKKVEEYLKTKENIDLPDAVGQSPIFYAIRGKLSATLELLLAAGNKIDCLDKAHHTPVYFATVSDNPEMLEFFFKHGLTAMSTFEDGLTPLHYAASVPNQEKNMAYLLEKEFPIDAKTNDGSTPLHLAIKAKQGKNVAFLLAHGADANTKNKAQETPLMLSESGEISKLLILKGAPFVKDLGTKTLLWGGSRNDFELVEYLLKNGTNANVRGNNNMTLLHLATQNGDLKMVEFLISQGADLESRDGEMCSPLHIAAKSGNKELVEIFLAKDAEVGPRNFDDKTPADEAEKNKHHEIAQILSQKKN